MKTQEPKITATRTVAELIAALQRMPQDARVIVDDGDGEWDVLSVHPGYGDIVVLDTTG